MNTTKPLIDLKESKVLQPPDSLGLRMDRILNLEDTVDFDTAQSGIMFLIFTSLTSRVFIETYDPYFILKMKKLSNEILLRIMRAGIKNLFIQPSAISGVVNINGDFTNAIVDKFGEGGNAELRKQLTSDNAGILTVRRTGESIQVDQNITSLGIETFEFSFDVSLGSERISIWIAKFSQKRQNAFSTEKKRKGLTLDDMPELIGIDETSPQFFEYLQKLLNHLNVQSGNAYAFSSEDLTKIGKFRADFFIGVKKWNYQTIEFPGTDFGVDVDEYDGIRDSKIVVFQDGEKSILSTFRFYELGKGISADLVDRLGFLKQLKCLATETLDSGKKGEPSSMEQFAKHSICDEFIEASKKGEVITIERLAFPNLRLLELPDVKTSQEMRVLQLFLLYITLAQVGVIVTNKYRYILMQTDASFDSFLKGIVGSGYTKVAEVIQMKQSGKISEDGTPILQEDRCITAVLDVKEFISYVQKNIPKLWNMVKIMSKEV